MHLLIREGLARPLKSCFFFIIHADLVNFPGTQLAHYRIRPYCSRGICLLINNVPKLALEAEKQLRDLFRYLSFNVKVRRSLKTLQMYKVAQEFAKKDHSKFDFFVVIIMSLGQGNDICGAEGGKASLEQMMTEYTATKCPSLRGKPKLFFVERVTFVKPSNVRDGSTQAQCSTDTEIETQPAFPLVFNVGNNCPEGADFLITWMTSAVAKAKPVPEVLSIQVLIDAIRNWKSFHLLDILTKVNACMVDKHRSNRVMAAQVPYQNHTLRAKVHLGLPPFPDQDAGSAIPGYQFTDDIIDAQRNRYELEKRPRGYCVIINNVKFRNRKDDRPGAVEDERSLKQIFDDLFFTVIVKTDLTKHQMENVAAEYGAKDHTTFDAFVMIVMSHGGDGDCIMGVDGRETSVKNLMVEFQETKCPSLKKKPKVFIIQTCRGESGSPAYNVSSQAVPSTSTQVNYELCDASLLPDSTLPRSVFPAEADFVLAFATVPGYVSYRSPTDGTYFIQSLVKTIREHRHHHHFLEILMQITKLVVKKEEEGSRRRPTVQVPASMHTLTKCLYL
ncbi:caspase-1-A-like [Orbicella faveolata]|uniref:caspase-1-A-like n=1 Tax=Orbicella faveolata TaxID=48498 RepID=UPI0009E2D6CF|nr:caspase-1-A-like [Orbicella faveolata]